MIWNDAYAALEPHGMSVVGGRVSGIDVASFTLGGGTRTVLRSKNCFSYLIYVSAQVDQSTRFDDFVHEIVLPNGSVVSAT